MMRASALMTVRAADPAEFALLEHAQKLHLQLDRHVADLVEEERAAAGGLEAADAAFVGAGERAALMAEELAFEEVARDRRAVQRHERAAPARRVHVDGACDQLLAGAALALDEDGRVAVGEAADGLEDLLHRHAGADERDAGLVASDHLRADAADGILEPVHFGGTRDECPHLVEIEGLREVVEGAAFHRFDGVRHRVLRGDHDHDDRRFGLADACQHVEAAHVGHPDVEDRDIVGAADQPGERFAARARDVDLVPGLRERRRENEPDRFFVVGDQDACHQLLSPGMATGKLTRNRVHRPGSLSTRNRPPCWVTRRWLTARPRPVPLFLVVKKGVKMRS